MRIKLHNSLTSQKHLYFIMQQQNAFCLCYNVKITSNLISSVKVDVFVGLKIKGRNVRRVNSSPSLCEHYYFNSAPGKIDVENVET